MNAQFNESFSQFTHQFAAAASPTAWPWKAPRPCSACS